MNDDLASDPQLAADVEHAETIVRTCLEAQAETIAARRAGPLIAALRQRVQELSGQQPVSDGVRSSGQDHEARVARAAAGTLLHRATMAARAAAAAGDTKTLVALCRAF